MKLLQLTLHCGLLLPLYSKGLLLRRLLGGRGRLLGFLKSSFRGSEAVRDGGFGWREVGSG
jgi:hypothetical protein